MCQVHEQGQDKSWDYVCLLTTKQRMERSKSGSGGVGKQLASVLFGQRASEWKKVLKKDMVQLVDPSGTDGSKLGCILDWVEKSKETNIKHFVVGKYTK